MYAFICTL